MSNSERVRKPRAFPGLDAERGPARPLSSVDTQWLVEQAVDRALGPDKPLRTRPLRLKALSLAAVVVVTSAAAATVVHQTYRRHAVLSAPTVSAPQQPPKKSASGIKAGGKGASDSPSANEPMELGVEPAASIAVAPVVHTGSSISLSAVDPAPEPAIVDELSSANDLRRKAQWQAAEAAYRSIAARFPRAPEAAVAELAAAELRLGHLGDAAGALRLYRAVPRSSALGVEALFGVSRAERALGDLNAEAATLRSLVNEYPTSLQADGARARLKQLSAESTAP